MGTSAGHNTQSNADVELENELARSANAVACYGSIDRVCNDAMSGSLTGRMTDETDW